MTRRNQSRNRNRGARRGRGSTANVRTDRIGSTLRAIIADELSRIGDESVAHVAVTEVEVDNELSRARVYLSSLDLDDQDIAGVVAHAPRIKSAIARRASIRRIPELEFHIDPGLVAGSRVESILRDMADDRAFSDQADTGQAATDQAEREADTGQTETEPDEADRTGSGIETEAGPGQSGP